tara:strand:- start:119 stop:1057 length:939 start_codon:yes stop_codon:yes gene_type:complete
MLLLLAILIFIFIIFYCLNYINDKNFNTVEVVGELKKEKTQKMRKNALLSLLNDISSADKVILENITDEWIMTKDIIDESMKNEVNGIIEEILSSLSNVSDHKFYINNIENMYVMKDSNGNYRCILNCFIFEVIKYYTIKLSMDIVSYDGVIYFNFIDIDESSIASILDKYDIKYDGSGILSNHEMFDKNTKDILDNYYYNNYDIVFLNNKHMDVDNTTLFTIDQLKNKHLPSNIPKDPNHPYFCNKSKRSWDNKGIKDIGGEICVSNDNTYGGILNTPTNGPGRITDNPDNNIHRWLFNKSMGPLKSSAQY